MVYIIPDAGAAAFPYQAQPDPVDFTALALGIGGSGVVSGCAVTQNGGGAMSVLVAAGIVTSLGTRLFVTAATVTVGANASGNPRIDLIVVNAAGTATIRAGTAAGTPLYPTLTAGDVLLAAVSVPNGAASILTANLVLKDIPQIQRPYPIIYSGTPGSTGAASANVTAWNTAISALPAAGGTVIVPAGTYYVNANLSILRNHVRILGEPGSAFKLVNGANVVMLTIGAISGGNITTDIIIDGIELDGTAILQNIANSGPGASLDSTFGGGTYSRTISSFTNTTNAVVTVTGATWTTNAFVGLWLLVPSSFGAGQSRLITANTGSTITVSGVFGGTLPIAGTDLIEVCSQSATGGSGWEVIQGNVGIAIQDSYRVTVKNCWIHDTFGGGVIFDRVGQVECTGNTFDNNGMCHVMSNRNAISCIGAAVPANTIPYPARNVIISSNVIRRICDVGIDIHGGGTTSVTCVGNSISDISGANGGASSQYGIAVEIESADTTPNVGTVVSGNNVDGVNVGISVVNTGNNAQNFAAIAITGNVVTHSGAALNAEGHHLVISGNTFWNNQRGIAASNATAVGLSFERDWIIAGNAINITPGSNGFGNAAVFLRWNDALGGANLNTGAVTAATNVSPIVLTVPSWTTQPLPGSVIVVRSILGNTAANGAWEVQAATATTVTLKGSIGNGAFATSASSTVKLPGRSLDSISIVGNVLEGAGTGNSSATHAGIYIEAMDGLNVAGGDSSIAHVNIGPNSIHGFQHAVNLVSGGINGLVLDTDIRDVRAWNNATGINIGTGAIRGMTIANCDLGSNTTLIAGNTAGVGGNVDKIHHVTGWSPVGLLTLPRGSIPAAPVSTTVYANDTNYDCMVYLSGGTVTVVSVQGQTTGLTTPAAVRVPQGSTLAITFSVVPTWKWFAE